jgi:hypothetical protein
MYEHRACTRERTEARAGRDPEPPGAESQQLFLSFVAAVPGTDAGGFPGNDFHGAVADSELDGCAAWESPDEAD